jgi:hypothetical protein
MLVAWRGLDRSAPLGDEAVLHIVETLQLKMDDMLSLPRIAQAGQHHSSRRGVTARPRRLTARPP